MAHLPRLRDIEARIDPYVGSVAASCLVGLLMLKVILPAFTDGSVLKPGNLAVLVGGSAILGLLAAGVLRTLSVSSPRTRRRVAVAGWLFAVGLIILTPFVELTQDNGFAAAGFLVVMALFVSAIWDLFPGRPSADAEARNPN